VRGRKYFSPLLLLLQNEIPRKESRWGHRAVFSYPTLFAAVFAKTLIARYTDHQPIGQALFSLRRELLARNNPLGLWYSLQCPLDVKAPEQ